MNRQYYYLGIADLIIPKTAPYEETHAAINRFIDGIPGLIEMLENKIGRGDFKNFEENINCILPLINDVNARVLEADAKLIVRRMELTGYPSALVRQFISNLMTLSLKMQKAQNYGDEIEHITNLETHTEIVQTLSSFISLVSNGDFAEAKGMIADMMVFDQETIFAFDGLLTLMINNDYDEAASVAGSLREKHTGAIREAAGENFTVNILAVDDMPESLAFVSNVLKDHFKVFRVTSGETALKVIKTQKIDLFVLDVSMPEMDGYELAEAIRGTPGYEVTPIIFLTGNSSRDHVIRAMQAGGNDFVIKPTNYEILLTSVNKYAPRI